MRSSQIAAGQTVSGQATFGAFPPNANVDLFDVRIVPLDQPQSFLASLRAPGLQAQEFRLHHRSLLALEAERLGLTPPNPARPDTESSIAGAAPVRPGASPMAPRCCVLGFVLPKRVCKHAVRRNLIRRHMREGLRAHLLQAPDWPLEPPVLVLKLTRKLPETFSSARSPLLGRYVRQQLQALLSQYSARLARLPVADVRSLS
ncbi:conserved hypothetical protein [Thiomonas sp. X19]|uniref:ribonuclease P protein component n=1 Tax=Thiomonas sp. X19 TaxID=1050370 RepID=UPI000B704BAC|nr:ribonuclease P protein component [Thiomonas sp. X19]SCC91353.1 conserved hypothetical protein [Thiomonas sp. X19]